MREMREASAIKHPPADAGAALAKRGNPFKAMANYVGSKSTVEKCRFKVNGEHQLRHDVNRNEIGAVEAWADYCSMCGLIIRCSNLKQVGSSIFV
jgi:hypothetical protein